MASKLSTKVNLSKIPRPRARKKKSKNSKRNVGFDFKKKTRKLSLFVGVLFYFILLFLGIGVFNYLHTLNSQLPPIDTPFIAYGLTSNILDRNGIKLYQITGDYVRSPLNFEELPEYVKWAFLAGEDMDFYQHSGIDPSAMFRCSLYLLDSSKDSFCGGSTVTQQLVKMTSLGYDVAVERKLKEVMMATKLENEYEKDSILKQYMSVVPMGSNIYGITRGAEFYFGKQPKELTLAQATLLAAIIQNPAYSSPTLGLPDPETARERAKKRQAYILNQLERNMSRINSETRDRLDDQEIDDVITLDMIIEARSEELSYKDPIFTDKKAGHFVDYTQRLLTTRPYNNGRPFTSEELAFGGYTIYTTLDYRLQKVAERTVKNAAKNIRRTYRGNNAAMLTLKPSTGEIIAMVGSKDYNAKSYGCNKKKTRCLFDPQVNIMTTKQSPGSSTKPFGTYEAYRRGTLYTGSLVPDVPINVGGGYNLKNWNGTFFGVSRSTYAANMLCQSRNLPAVITLETIGIPAFLQTMRKFGYSTFNNPKQYGHSVILGGSDVIGVEHAQAFGVFANNGTWVQHEVVKKIVDRQGNVVYEHKPVKKKVGDARAAYMVNYSLLNCFQPSWDGRHVAAKTGTSQDNADGWTVLYSPDFVTVGWVGNNNNRPMTRNAFGVTAVMPWLKTYMKQVGNTSYFRKKSRFRRPAGLVFDGGGSRGFARGLRYRERPLRAEVYSRYVTVCKDQPFRKARPIDIKEGKAVTKLFRYYKMPVPHWQWYLDRYLKSNGGPIYYCTVPRK